jgi:FkbH-like protein
MTTQSAATPTERAKGHRAGRIKCVVWDLDNTLWNGTLVEHADVTVVPGMLEIIRALDERGILHSIASKNDDDLATGRLEELGISEYFLAPQISWGPKSVAIERIAEALNLGTDAFAFVDDQPAELAEVAFAHPEVMCVLAADVATTVRQEEFHPIFITSESRQRRKLYQTSAKRTDAQREFIGTSENFLATLDIRLSISEAQEEDLRRAEELTVRTHQLNSTGRTFSYAELEDLRCSPDHLLLVVTLDDRFGSQGVVALAVVEKASSRWRLCLLLTSCRVVACGVGTILLNHVMRLARDHDVELLADFVETGRNRMMYVSYMFAGFDEISRDSDRLVLRSSLERVQDPPPYITVEVT